MDSDQQGDYKMKRLLKITLVSVIGLYALGFNSMLEIILLAFLLKQIIDMVVEKIVAKIELKELV